jgi:ATP-dependent RNA helicase RhlE
LNQQTFDTLGLVAELVRAVHDEGYTVPTPVQAQAIPFILAGRDVLAGAQTGTGKTAGFTLPMLQRLAGHTHHGGRHAVRALVVTPTRELAAQIEESIRTYGKYMSLRSALVFGGVGMQPQVDALRRGVDILVATPGRLLDHVGQKTVNLSHIEILVLDEADRMLDMGFIHDIRKILALLPKKRQNLLFSATYTDEIRTLAGGLLHDPAYVQVAPRNAESELVAQRVHPVDQARKRALLAHLVSSGDWRQVLVFTRTKHGANRLAEQLCKDGIESAAIHGNKSQGARTRALANFKSGDLRVLVATDLAARGLDIEQLPHVVNYELPNVPEQYVHRIGRTGRAGVTGEAISLVSPDEHAFLADIEKLMKRKVERTTVPGFEPGSAPSSAEQANREPPRREHARREQPRREQPRRSQRQSPQGGQPGRSGSQQRPSRQSGRSAAAGSQQRPPARTNADAHNTAHRIANPDAGAEARQPMSNDNARFPSSGAVYGNGARPGQQENRRERHGSAREVPALLGGATRRNG